jgi:hypothetical protein
MAGMSALRAKANTNYPAYSPDFIGLSQASPPAPTELRAGGLVGSQK